MSLGLALSLSNYYKSIIPFGKILNHWFSEMFRVHQDPLKWLEVGASESSASVKLNGGHSGYMFGIAVTTVNGRSSGIQWTCSFYNIHSGEEDNAVF